MFITVNEIAYENNDGNNTHQRIKGALPAKISVDEILKFRKYGVDNSDIFKDAGIINVTRIVFKNGKKMLIEEDVNEFEERINAKSI